MKKKLEAGTITKQTFTTFRPFGYYEQSNLTQDTPSCFNGMCRVVLYKITVERIEEPKEVIHARIQKLWDESNNHHDYEALQATAKTHGYTLQGERGKNRRSHG